jgi:hypothetical protein
MNFIARLANRQRVKRAIRIIREGKVIRLDFHPTRKGALRMAHGRDAIEISWIQRRIVDQARLNLKHINLEEEEINNRLLNAILMRADQVMQENQGKFARHLPQITPSSKERLVSPLAQRLAQAVFEAKHIKDHRNTMGFGAIRVGLPHLSVELHTLEDHQLPAITINGLPIFSSKSDISHVAHAITTRLRPMIEASDLNEKTLEYEYAA